MPVECRIDKERRLVIGSAWGAISFADVKGYQDKLLADPEFNPEFERFLRYSITSMEPLPTERRI